MLAVSPSSWGKWQTIFFTSGAESAACYCDSVIESLDKTREFFEEMMSKAVGNQELYEAAEKLHDFCEERQGRYAPDVFLGTKEFMRGRGELGRTPFNYPDYRHRFSKIEDLSEYLTNKSKHHLECYYLLDNLIRGFPEDEKALKAEQFKHYSCMLKWDFRIKSAFENPNAFLLPTAMKTPLQIMNFEQLHQRGYYGSGAEATVVEGSDVDRTHPFLRGVFADDDNPEATDAVDIERLRHTTMISGVIAAQWNQVNNHMGAAPLAKLRILNVIRELKPPESEIVNQSGGYSDNIWDILHDEELMHYSLTNVHSNSCLWEFKCIAQLPGGDERMQLFRDLYRRSFARMCNDHLVLVRNKLQIQSMGNDGVDICLNPALIAKKGYFLENFEPKNLFIRVVSLQKNGLYPDPVTTFPGAHSAESTVCAIGIDVLTTDVGGYYCEAGGTSVAAPYATSVALILKGAFPSLSKEQIRWCILEGATPIILDPRTFEPRLIEDRRELRNYSVPWITACRLVYGRGLLNAEGAFEMAQVFMDSQAAEAMD